MSQIDYQNEWFDKFDETQERSYGYERTWLKRHQRKTRQRLSPLNRNTPVSSELLALVSKSKDTPLSPEEEQVLIKDLKSLQADQLLNVVLPSSIPEIIECNPEIAVALFVVTDKFNELELYFSPLLSSPALTLNSLNVVNKLTTNIPISSDLVHRFVNRCISLCEVYSERGDVDRRDRWVRLVCLFIQSLIRNRVIYLEDYIIELQSFCLGNSRIKEAAALYRVVTGGSSGITGN
ncbi:hypothetical protein BKA69DRAFT_126132 [Paraphysoderma sedebokerense]|nr:hypothetical protein BKA69DRAFT_126132 [Paraphysoderma sedebokerense]